MGYGKREFRIDGTPDIRFLNCHHSGVAYDMKDKSEAEVLKSFSDTGFDREYRPYGYDKATGISPVWGKNDSRLPGTDQPSYIGYHYLVWPYDVDGNKYGHKIALAIEDPLRYRVNSTGYDRDKDPPVQIKRIEMCNQHEIAICFVGLFVNKRIDIRALHLVAFALDWIWKLYPGIEVHPHNYWQPTACPGKIAGQLDLLQYAFQLGIPE